MFSKEDIPVGRGVPDTPIMGFEGRRGRHPYDFVVLFE